VEVLLGAGGLGGCGPPAAGAPSLGGSGMQLPTLNLMRGGAAAGTQTPQNIQQMQAQAVQGQIDNLCPGKTRQSTNVGSECWAIIWTNGGCKAENVPSYAEWHQTQSLEVLVADVVQWANLPDERHQQGCYGSNGAPINESPPPAAMPGLSPLGVPPNNGLPPASLGMGGCVGGGIRTGVQAADVPPEVAQKIQLALDSPALPSLCSDLTRQSIAVGEACWEKIWVHVGCREDTTPPYLQWHDAQSLEVLVADAAQWASLPSESHQQACYGNKARTEL